MANQRFIQYFWIVTALTALGLGIGPRTAVAAETPPPEPGEEIEVLASGPVHEAFAEAVPFNPEPGIVAPKAPPALIEEVPPDQKPEGAVQWIPGYWAWDDERDAYIWVSGTWRIPPPGRQWVPGYWTPVAEGYQWISGYWASVKAESTEYLPEPPESVEVGPSSNAPSPGYTWIPGCWVWHYGRYAWRPGYWAVVHPDWIWVPSHYVWTPRGYVFVGGYWDYPVIRRGVLFAPVYFAPRVFLGVTFSFSPGFVISLNIFDDALFVRARYCHYYYGDYYAPRHYRRGIYPWFSLHARRAVYDPIYAHQRWKHRNDHKWETRLHTTFRERREREDLRPARSFDHRIGQDRAVRASGPQRPKFVMPLDRTGKSRPGGSSLKPLNEKERREFSQREKEVRIYSTERQRRETQPQKVQEQRDSKEPVPGREKFSRSPIMDRNNQKSARKSAPPARYEAPKPNPNVEPLQRSHEGSRALGRPQNREDVGQKPELRGQRSMENVQRSENGGAMPERPMENSHNRQQRRNGGRQR